MSTTEKMAVATEIGSCFLVQKHFGKPTEDLDATIKIFLSDLEDYTADQIINAVTHWRKTHSEVPTPADIIGIIERRPKICSAFYRKILESRKTQGWLGFDEQEYLKFYEKSIFREV